MAKLSSFKMKERILAEAKKVKPKGIQIYEDFSKAVVEIRKKNWEKVKELRAQNKFAILVYDKIYIVISEQLNKDNFSILHLNIRSLNAKH